MVRLLQEVGEEGRPVARGVCFLGRVPRVPLDRQSFPLETTPEEGLDQVGEEVWHSRSLGVTVSVPRRPL